MRSFRPGDHIILREFWKGRVGSVRPVILVEDSPEAIIVYTPAGSIGLFPHGADGRPLRVPAETWTLRERIATYHHVLGIQVRGDSHGTLFIWDPDWLFRSWYINWKSRSGGPRSDSTIRTMFSISWCHRPFLVALKDEDELEKAVAKGVYATHQARELRVEGQRALKRLLARGPPLDKT